MRAFRAVFTQDQDRTPAVDRTPERTDDVVDPFWGDLGDGFDPETLFACRGSIDGHSCGISLFRDRIVLDGDRDHSAPCILRVDEVEEWGTRADEASMLVGIRSDDCHSGRLPKAFERPLRIAMTTLLGPSGHR
ncbi:hypothetical protein AS850_14905 [Frondihabitans sp. 762G35]|nr:hypothetical protein AS850_14905 [Frondihabitans sp. 762G35]